MKNAKLIHVFLLLGIATVFTVWSFWRFMDAGNKVESEWDMTGQMTLDEVVTSKDTSVLRRNGRDAVVLFPGSEAQFSWDETESHLDVHLLHGALLFATLAGDMNVRVQTEFARIDSQNNMAYVRLDESGANLDVYALQHPGNLSFLLNNDVLNSLSVPAGYRIKVPQSKISSTIGRLRLTKLTKEFPNFALKEEDLSEVLKKNIQDVESAYQESSLEFLNDLQAKSELGPSQSGFSAQLADGVQAFEEAVTVFPHAKLRLESTIEAEVLTYAMSHLLFGDPSAGEAWLLQWSQLSHDPAALQDLYASLFFVLPGDALYPLKSAVADVVYSNDHALDSLRRQYQEIENLLSRSSLIEAEAAYDVYKADFLNQLERGIFDQADFLDDLSREYILLEILLRNHSPFYTVSDTEILTALEKKILSFAGTDQDLDEERQAFIQSKLRFLSNLFAFVIDRAVSPEDAQDLANALLFQAQSYLGSVSSQVAVQDYFESQLEDYALSIQFMGSPEFYSYESFAIGLETYRQKVKDLEELNAYLQNLRTGRLEEADLGNFPSESQAIQSVEQALRQNGIQYAQVIPQGDAAHRLFEIAGARTEGHAFDANYDRETEILYDVVAEGVRFSTGILLSSASEVIASALEKPETVPVEDTAPETVPLDSGTSLAESVALDFVETQFEEAGLSLDDFEIRVTDLSSNSFSFTGVITAERLPVSGVYMSDTGRVMGTVWEYKGELRAFPDVDLKQLAPAISATHQALEAASK